MKNLILISSFVLALSTISCTKNYSCTCTTNITEPGYVPYQTASVVEVKKHTSKKKATLVCRNTAKQMEANTRLLFDDNNLTITTSCSLQEK